jgi:hypothetical protein
MPLISIVLLEKSTNVEALKIFVLYNLTVYCSHHKRLTGHFLASMSL